MLQFLGMLNTPRNKLVWNRMKTLVTNGWWLSRNAMWIAATSGIVLVMPVVFFYEQECQMLESQAQFEAMYKAANAPQLTS